MAEERAPQDAPAMPREGRARAVIEAISPQVDHGRFAVKRLAGDRVDVGADCFTDGHDVVAAVVRFRREDESGWHEAQMRALGNDRYRGTFMVASLGRYRYTVCAWVDPFLSWRHDFARRVEADDIRVAARVGARLLKEASARAEGDDRRHLAEAARHLAEAADVEVLRSVGLDEALREVAQRHPDRTLQTTYPVEFPLVVERPRAGFSSWYELFPRSTSGNTGVHGTFRDCEARLPYVAQMGFDVLYLPPIHPIGRMRRKGPNNTLAAGPDDVGSPWAIGAEEGGHKAVHPALGTLEDLRRLREAAPACRVLGVQAELAPAMTLSWRANRPIDTDAAATYADGIAARVAIPLAVELMAGRVDDMVLVSEEAMHEAQAELTDALGITVEGAAAASWAALLVGPRPDGPAVVIVTGSNA
jgi:starch synthase (maltosyl-transferring)